MLTLVGPGGAGKSRLGLELAREAEAEGAVLVELAAIADPGLVEGAAASALEVQALPDRPLVDAVVDFLAPRRLLLVLDNCEHVLAASAVLADGLLRAAPMLRIVATSREPLRVPGEVVFRVPSLTIPDPEQPCSPADLRRYEAVRLFVERAAAAAPGFVLDEGNAADVARICFRLDGLPLALELAAGRLGALSPASIAERLDDRFRLLRAGSRAAPTRQQTLAATLQWSHDLLAPDERVLYRRLAAFGGGFDLDAAEVVCAGDGLDGPEVADTLGRLVEKSLVVADQLGGERRYRLLETVRADARGRLDAAGEGPALADRHAAWALALAEREGGSPRLDREGPNLRTALDTLTARAPTDALRLCVALRPFWLRRIDLAEAERRFADRAGEGAGAHRAPRRGPARVGLDRLPRGHARPRTRPRPGRGELRHRRGDRRPPGAVAGAPVPGRAGRRARRRRPGRALAGAGARAGPPGGVPGRRGAVRLLARRDPLDHGRPGRRRGARSPRAPRRSARWPARAERITSPLNIAEMRERAGARPPRPADRLRGDAAAVRRDLLRRGRGLRARQLGRRGPRARRPPAGDGAARGGRGAVHRRRRPARPGRRAGAARLPRARAGRRRLRAGAAAGGARAAPGPRRPPRGRPRPGRSRPGRDGRGRIRRRRALPGRGARPLPPRRRPLGPGQHALAHGRPRVRPRPGGRRGGGAAGGAGGAGRDRPRALDRAHRGRPRRGGPAPGRRRGRRRPLRRGARALRGDGGRPRDGRGR